MIGRPDDTLIVKGVNLYPAAIRDIATTFVSDVKGTDRMVLDNPLPRVVATLMVKIEHRDGMRPEMGFFAAGTFPPRSRKALSFEKKCE